MVNIDLYFPILLKVHALLLHYQRGHIDLGQEIKHSSSGERIVYTVAKHSKIFPTIKLLLNNLVIIPQFHAL
ncbi:hypothetical protein D3C80_2066530 [compost metagenome]